MAARGVRRRLRGRRQRAGGAVVDAVKDAGEHHGVRLYEDAEQIAQVWEIREGGVGNSKVPGEHPGWPSWEDAAVAPDQIGDYLRDLESSAPGTDAGSRAET